MSSNNGQRLLLLVDPVEKECLPSKTMLVVGLLELVVERLPNTDRAFVTAVVLLLWSSAVRSSLEHSITVHPIQETGIAFFILFY